MPRHESAFETDDPILIAAGEYFRKLNATDWTEEQFLTELGNLLMIVRPSATTIVATSPTVIVHPAAQESYRLSDQEVQDLGGDYEPAPDPSVSVTDGIEYTPDDDYVDMEVD